MDGSATVTTSGSLTIDGSDGRLKVDGYGGSGGGDITIGGDLVNGSPGSRSATPASRSATPE